jgi:uncharacterized protein YllA (UPF0747 family)
MTLGGRRVPVRRPRMRTADDEHELSVRSYEYFADLASDQLQELVERIAGAPEIRAAIASQAAGLITDIGIRLTVITERIDDRLERFVRSRDADSETNQARFD